MIKVGFLKELKPGDLIVLPGGGREPLRFSAATLGPFAEAVEPPQDSDEVLRALIASRKQRGQN
ncbi:MAG: hypothetical protein WB760_05890 [Xanthobacteraceae bacterium]